MTKIPPYYQNIIDLVHEFSVKRHRASFIGMFNCGIDFIFRNISSEQPRRDNPLLLPIDLNNTGSNRNKIYSAFYLSFSKHNPDLTMFHSYEDVWSAILNITKTQPITLILYFGDENHIDLEFIENIYRWRNSLGDLLNWIIFANYRVLNSKNSSNALFEKFTKVNLIPVLPIDYANSMVVYRSYEEYFGPIKKYNPKKIITLSGGNPGLLKSLFLLAQKDKINDWLSDIHTIGRLTKILDDLSKKEIQTLSLLVKNKKAVDKKSLTNLLKFGYVNERMEVFSPLILDYIPYYYDTVFTYLSSTQQRIYQSLKDKSPSPLIRDEIAKLIWGKRWQEDYSDWAIDQMIYTMRKILIAGGSQWKIGTKRNVGYFIFFSKSHGNYKRL